MASDAEAPAVVEIVDDNAPAPEAAPESAPAADAHTHAAEAPAAKKEATHKYSKAEKKARKAILKLGLKEIPNVFRVTLKRSPNVCSHSRSPPLSLSFTQEPPEQQQEEKKKKKTTMCLNHTNASSFLSFGTSDLSFDPCLLTLFFSPFALFLRHRLSFLALRSTRALLLTFTSFSERSVFAFLLVSVLDRSFPLFPSILTLCLFFHRKNKTNSPNSRILPRKEWPRPPSSSPRTTMLPPV